MNDIRADTAELSPRLAADLGKWLDWQSRMIHGVRNGAVFLAPHRAEGELRLAALWPAAEVDPTTLAGVAARCLRTGAGVVQKVADKDAVVHDHVGHPVFIHGRIVAAVSLAMSVRSDEQRRAVTQLQQWCAVWLEKLLEPAIDGRRGVEALPFEALLVVSRDAPLPLALNALCTLLAERLECSRVAIGLCRGLQVRAVALSDQIAFDRRTERLRELERAMEECVDRDESLVLPSDIQSDGLRPTAHAQLISRQGSRAVCSVPLRLDGRIIGVATCLREDGDPFEAGFVEELTEIAACVTPIVHRQYRLERAFGGVLGRAPGALLTRLPGARRFGPVFAMGLCMAVLLALSLVRVDHRVAAASVVEGTLQRAIVAPFPGRLSAVHARAGDRVEQGDVLLEIDDGELRLERDRQQSDRDRIGKAYQLALASRDRAEVAMSAARLAQSEAELQLVQSRLARTQLTAPFAGMLVAGDWSQALGTPIDTGELLFEIVPLEGYRLILEIDEHDVARVSVGQQGTVRLAGLPSRPLGVTVSNVLPIATAHDGGNFFRVEADVQEPPGSLRPGMRGVAKIIVGKTSLARVWSGELVERLRLWFWSLGL